MNTTPIAVGVCLTEEHALDLDAFAAACGTEAEFVRLLVEEGLLAPAMEQPSWRFGGEELSRVRRIRRLQRAFEANLQSVAVMLDLIDEAEQLRAQLHRAGIVPASRHIERQRARESTGDIDDHSQAEQS